MSLVLSIVFTTILYSYTQIEIEPFPDKKGEYLVNISQWNDSDIDCFSNDLGCNHDEKKDY